MIQPTGEVICHCLDRVDILRLRGLDESGYRVAGKTSMVRLAKTRESVWVALVDASVIRAEVRRKISRHLPVAQANNTVRLISRETAQGIPVRYYELNTAMIFRNYGPWAKAA